MRQRQGAPPETMPFEMDYEEEPVFQRSRLRTHIAAIAMLVVGSCLLLAGLVVLFHNEEDSIPLFVLGAMTFIPGSYASWTLFGSYMKWPGFKADDIPSYD